MTTYSLFSDAKRDTALTAVGGEMMGTQDTELLKQIFVAAGNGGGSSGGALWGDITGTLSNQTDLQNAINDTRWLPNSFAFIDPVSGNDTTGDGTSGKPWATAAKGISEGFYRFITAPGDAGTITVSSISGGIDLYVNGLSANDFIDTGAHVNEPQTQITINCDGTNNEHVHIYSNKGVTINLSGHGVNQTGADFFIYNAVVGTVDCAGVAGANATETAQPGGNGGNGPLLYFDNCLILGDISANAGVGGNGGNHDEGVNQDGGAGGYAGNGAVVIFNQCFLSGTLEAFAQNDGANGTVGEGGNLIPPPTGSSPTQPELRGTFTNFAVNPDTFGPTSRDLKFCTLAALTASLGGTGLTETGTAGNVLTSVSGGTWQSRALSMPSVASNNVLLSNGTSDLQAVAPSTSGNVLTSNGSTWQSAAPAIIVGSGSPEGVVTASVGKLYSRTDGGAGTTLYVKESGAGNTGWVAK